MDTRLIGSQRPAQLASMFLPALIASAAIAAAVPFSAQAAPVGGPRYPGDGGAALYQEAVPEPVSDEWVDPAAVDPATSKSEFEPAPVEPQDDPALSKGGGETGAGPWLEPAPVAAVPSDPAPGIEPAPVDTSLTGATEPWGHPVATAYIAGTSGEGAACHVAPEHATGTLAVLGEGQPVDVRGEAVGEWQPVNCAGAGGYVHTSLLSWTPMPAPAAGDEGGQQKLETGAGGTGGEQIVSFAMQFQGYPYIYAGEGPYAFDCSGFTMFVIHNTLGTDIPHDMFVQYEMGQPVGRESLQPGDLVFFANTFRPGMSHNGIYIGGGQFIHAERESSGVTVSDLNDDYYSSRWYGAVRFP
jgi:cell wall-associated NlpC family hydrolase